MSNVTAPRFPASNRIRQVHAAGGRSFGLLLSISAPRLVECAAIAGADFVVADLEHHPFDQQPLEAMILAAEARGIAFMAKTPDGDPKTIMRLLDMGVQSILVADVRTARQAHEIARAARYAPEGHRGMDLSRGSGFSRLVSPQEYAPFANADVVVGVMIESAEGAANVAEICGTPGIDMVQIGPTDLSMSLGHHGDPQHPEVVAAVDRVRRIALGSGVIVGSAVTNAASIQQQTAEGITMFVSSVTSLVIDSVEQLSAACRVVAGS